MATLTPASEERPPGPASVARFAVTRGNTVENARWGTETRLNADNMVASSSTRVFAMKQRRTLTGGGQTKQNVKEQ